MRDTAETWRAGATWYRNSMDWTEEERDAAIRVANEVLNQQAPANFQPPTAPNTTTSFASTGSRQLGLDSLTMESQVEIVQSPNSEDFQTAASSQDEADEDEDEEEDGEQEEDERRLSLPRSSKRPGKAKSRRQTSSRKKRSREGSGSVGSTSSSSQEAAPQASAAEKGRGRGRGKKPVR